MRTYNVNLIALEPSELQGIGKVTLHAQSTRYPMIKSVWVRPGGLVVILRKRVLIASALFLWWFRTIHHAVVVPAQSDFWHFDSLAGEHLGRFQCE